MPRAVKTVVVTGPLNVDTGAGGYVGAELTKQLLSLGYTVRATVRKATPANSGFLETLAAGLPGNIEIVEGADLTIDGSFDKAVDGATYVFHVASPVAFGTGDPEQDQKNVVDPAVNGTLTVLASVAKQKSVKRVVLTSSVLAIANPMEEPPAGTLYSPDKWIEGTSVQNAALVYAHSKVEAEKAAWKFAKEHNIDLITILPTLVVGPMLNVRSGFSVGVAQGLVEGASFDTVYVNQFVDVRDVATAHILAAETASAKGRYIVSLSDSTNMKDIAGALASEFPEIAFGSARDTPPKPIWDTSKVEKELNMKLIPAATSFKDQTRTLLALGQCNPAFKN